MDAVVRIRALGGLSVARNGREVELRADEARLLARLLCHRHAPAPAALLAAALPDPSLPALRRTLAGLRVAMRGDVLPGAAPDPVVSVRGGVELHPRLVFTDLDEFEHAALTGLVALERDEPAEARMWLSSALAQCGGDVLEAVPFGGSWLDAERARVAGLVVAVAVALEDVLERRPSRFARVEPNQRAGGPAYTRIRNRAWGIRPAS